MVAVRIKELSHRYAKEWVVHDVSFDIDQTGITGLLGANGAGKSTCMNIMCGVLFPTQGDVFVEGLSIRDNPLSAKRKLGFLPQQAPLYPEFTVNEYLAYCAALRGLDANAIPDAVNKVMDQCGLSHFANRLIGALSGGYRQRCGIAQSIIHSPRIVILDEPTNGLDPVQILEVRNLIKSIGEDRAVLLSSHILSEVAAVCSHIKMISSGRMVFQGSFEEFRNRAKTDLVRVRFKGYLDPSLFSQVYGLNEVEEVADDVATFSIGNDAAYDEIHRICISNNITILEMSSKERTLEDVFADLDQPAPA